MSRHAAAGQAVPIVPFPAELVDRRPERQRSVGHAAGHHELGVALQGLDDGPGSQINVGADDWFFEFRQRLAGVEVFQSAAGLLQRGQRGQEIVAAHDADRQMTQTGATEHAGRLRCAAGRIHAAGIRHDAQLRLGGQHRRQRREHGEEIGRVAGAGVLLALPGQDRERQLGQVLERQVVDFGRFDQAARSIDVVPQKPGGVGDFQSQEILPCCAAQRGRRSDRGSRSGVSVRPETLPVYTAPDRRGE